jgi:hypothetical protein
MRFMSPYANKEINLPDEKVPEADRFSLKCPFTGGKIFVEKSADGVRAEAAEPLESRTPPGADGGADAEKLPSVEPELAPPGARIAFIHVRNEAWDRAAREYAEKAGFFVSTADDALTAAAKLRLNDYSLLFIEEGGDAARLKDEINSWPGLKRRAANFVLLGDAAGSMQPNAAFEKGANYYFNINDLDAAQRLFKEADDGYGQYYRPLREAEKKVFGTTEQ